MKDTEHLVVNELNSAWVDMFNNIDDVVEEITKYYPDFESKIDREIIKNAVKKTQRLSELLERGRAQMSIL